MKWEMMSTFPQLSEPFLASGWEPFAVTIEEGETLVWLRKQSEPDTHE